MDERLEEAILRLKILEAFGGDAAVLSQRVEELRKKWHAFDGEITDLYHEIGEAMEQAWLEKRMRGP